MHSMLPRGLDRARSLPAPLPDPLPRSSWREDWQVPVVTEGYSAAKQ
jgi:hypothetical protein